MASGGSAVNGQSFSPPPNAPAYLVDALKDVGIQEWVVGPGRKHISNPVVERYIEKVIGHPMNAIDTPWCAFFVGAKLEYEGITSSKSGMARSYLTWGQAVENDDWKCGDIVVFKRNSGTRDDHILGHVAFLLRWNDDEVWVCGGNQGDRVCIEAFDRGRIIGVRRPRSIMQSKTVLTAAGSATTQTAHAAVDNLLPATGDPSSLASMPHVISPTTGRMPTPDDLQAAYDQAHPYMTMLSHMKPEILGALTCISVGLALYAGWFRYQDWKNGRT